MDSSQWACRRQQRFALDEGQLVHSGMLNTRRTSSSLLAFSHARQKTSCGVLDSHGHWPQYEDTQQREFSTVPYSFTLEIPMTMNSSG
jgi:hypothetical protein